MLGSFSFNKRSGFTCQTGFTLIELLVAVSIITVMTITFFALLGRSLQLVQTKRIQAQAAALATEQMEIIHNLSYADVGTVGGVPAGSLPQEQTLNRGNTSFLIKTDIRYIDDPYDGLLGDQEETLNTDYKQVKITISWDSAWSSDSMFFLTNIVPAGVEETGGGGTLKINVFDASGAPVPQALVDVVNTNTSVNLIDLQTNDSGLIILPGMPADTDPAYQITVDKFLYSQARTYARKDPVVQNVAPNPEHLLILEGDTTEVSFVIDKISVLNIKTELDQSPNPALAISVDFSIHGSKSVGKDNQDNNIYKYPTALHYSPPSFTTDSSGLWQDNQIEWDSYTISFDEPSIGYNLIEYTPPNNPITVLPNQTVNITFLFGQPYYNHSLLITLKDSEGNIVDNANVRLVNSSLDYDQTLITGTTGQTFFGDLSKKTYEITITKTGLETINNDIEIDGNQEEKFILASSS